MLRLATDEDLDNYLLRALLRRKPDLDIVRVQDAGLSATSDDRVLEWAASENRVLLTHDVNTMTRQAYSRISEGKQYQVCLW
jgi:predicted nuclease of predicted toxin-antitoxin system